MKNKDLKHKKIKGIRKKLRSKTTMYSFGIPNIHIKHIPLDLTSLLVLRGTYTVVARHSLHKCNNQSNQDLLNSEN